MKRLALYIESLHILPILLQQGDKKVDAKMDIADQIILTHFHIPNGNNT